MIQINKYQEIIRYKNLEKKFTIFRWIMLIVVSPISFGLSDYNKDINYLVYIVLAGCIYNLLVTIVAYSKKDKYASILKTTIYFDCLFITIILCVRGGMRSDVFMLYFILILYNGAKFGYKGTISSLIQTLIYFSLASFVFTPQNFFSLSRYIIRIFYIMMTTFVIYQVNKVINESFDREQQAKDLAMKDILTDLPNRLLLSKYFCKMEQSYKEFGQPFCIGMVDIDNFKEVNDNMGHVFGDSVLVNLADIIKNNISENDFACRFGGEEFIIIFANSDIISAHIQAEKIRKKFEYFYSKDKKITLSIGISEYKDNYTMIDNINFADKNMYIAKNTGKNKIVSLWKSIEKSCGDVV